MRGDLPCAAMALRSVAIPPASAILICGKWPSVSRHRLPVTASLYSSTQLPAPSAFFEGTNDSPATPPCATEPVPAFIVLALRSVNLIFGITPPPLFALCNSVEILCKLSVLECY